MTTKMAIALFALWPLSMAGAFYMGREYEHDHLQPHIDAAGVQLTEAQIILEKAQEYMNAGKSAYTRAETLEPLVKQWRTGYEKLKAKCGE